LLLEAQTENTAHACLTSKIDRVDCQRHAPVALSSGKRLVIHFARGCARVGAGMDGFGKSRPQPMFEPKTVKAVTSCYTS